MTMMDPCAAGQTARVMCSCSKPNTINNINNISNSNNNNDFIVPVDERDVTR
ncbi:AGAP010688-PA [Anopheles gambiae str. PEST]|nr:AGAP010688-PA [Anopheles gambiae str. PEST]